MKQWMEKAIELYHKELTLTEIGEALAKTPQQVGHVLKQQVENYRPFSKKRLKLIMPEGGIKTNEPMTVRRRNNYEKAKRIYEFSYNNPDLSNPEISKAMGCASCTVSAINRRMLNHIKTGEPYFPPVRKKVGQGGALYAIPIVAKPKCDNPDEVWKAAYEAGLL